MIIWKIKMSKIGYPLVEAWLDNQLLWSQYIVEDWSLFLSMETY